MDGGLMAKTKDKPAKKDDSSFLAEALKRYERGYERDRENMEQAYEDLEFRAGNQWDALAEKTRRDESRPVLQVNQIPQFVRQVTGDMRMARPGIKVVPVDSRGDKDTGEILAGMIRYVESRSDAQYAYMVGGDSQVTGGIGHWQVVTEYAEESTFNQELRVMAVEDGVSVVWDPDSVLPTREDASYCFVPVDLSRAAFEERYPGKSPSDFGSTSEGALASWVTGDTVRVARYWEKRVEKRLLALNQDGSIEDLTDDPDGKKRIRAAVNNARVEKRDGACIYHSLICAGEVLEPAAKWPGRYIPIIPVLGEEVRIGRKLIRHGLVRFAKDPQRMYNYYCSAETEVVALQPKAPWLVTETNVEENEGQWETANSRNYPFLLWKPDPANGNAAPTRIQPPVSSQGIVEGMMRASEDLQRVTGIYLSSLGAQSNETSGKAINARDRQADVGTFVYLDNFARAIRHTGKILIDLIPHIYDTERMIRVVGEDGKVDLVEINKTVQEPMLEGEQPDILHDVTIGAYDVVLDSGPSYSTKREEAKEGMIEFLRTNPDSGPLIVDLVAKAQDWPLADEIADRLETVLPPPILQKIMQKKSPEEQAESQPPPPSPEEQAKAQLEMRDAEAEVSKKEQEAKKLMLENAEKEFQMKVQAAQLAGALPMPEPENQEPDPQLVQAIQQLMETVQQQGQQIAEISGALQAMTVQQPQQGF
jgi:hypothetical protein